MRFKNFELYVDNRVFDSSDMKQIVSADVDYFQHNKEIYLIDKKIIDERFLWIYCQFDNEKLYGETVLDKEAETTFENTRDKNHIELRKQLFVLYDNKTSTLYTNDFNKKSFIKAYLKSVLVDKEIVIKNIYASLDEFKNAVKKIKKIRFARRYDMIANMEPDSIFDPRGSIFGLDLPDKYVLQVEYENKPIEMVTEALNGLKRRRDHGYFEEIVLIGENDSGVEESFNFSTLMKNIEVNPYKNENERFDEKEVEKLILGAVR